MNSWFKLILWVQKFPMRQAQKELDFIHSYNRDEFLKWQEVKCWEIVKYHYAHNLFYQSHIGNNFPARWQDIPVLNKKDFQESLPKLISDEYSLKQLYVANTSGSTGNPFYFAKDKLCHALTWKIIEHYYSLYGIDCNDLQARFYGIPLSGKGKLIEQIKDFAMNRIRLPVFDLGDKKLEIYLEQFRKNKIVYIYGYTNAIRHFANFVTSKSIVLKSICPTLRTVIVTSEICTENDKSVMEKAFGVPVNREYGASETGIIAFDDKNGKFKVCEENIYIETNDANEILITCFYNKAFPIIRYNIGDMAILSRKDDGVFIDSLIGRSDDMIVLPNGKTAAGLTFYYCSRAILEKTSNIKELYITQKTISMFLINYISDAELSEAEIKIIKDNIEKALQPGLELIFERTNIIRRKKSGKFQLFTSELKN